MKAVKAHEGLEGYMASHIFNLSTYKSCFTLGKDLPAFIEQEAWWSQTGSFWSDTNLLPLPGIEPQSPYI